MGKKSLSTESYKGVRDFYPEDMFIEKYIFGKIRETVENFGYVEYGASPLEESELYRQKSGEEIVNEQTYSFKDRGDRDVTLRPEMTPTTARMVAKKRRELAFPLRWYSITNMFRYERPQRGRLREHFQLNVDLFGVEGIEAEIETITLASKILKDFGLKEENFEIQINSRKLLEKAYEPILKNKELFPVMLRLLDKKEKMGVDKFELEWKKLFKEPFEETKNYECPELKRILEILDKRGIKTKLNPYLVRGFDYYTDIVFEVFDTNPENRRSIFGGGRYDELLSLFGEENIPAVGFGMGDVTLKNTLETYDLLPQYASSVDIYLCIVEKEYTEAADTLASSLREKGLNVAVNYTYRKIGDQIKNANKEGAPYVVCVGKKEAETLRFELKELSTGKIEELSTEKIPDAIQK